jgi:hypothetical protein
MGTVTILAKGGLLAPKPYSVQVANLSYGPSGSLMSGALKSKRAAGYRPTRAAHLSVEAAAFLSVQLSWQADRQNQFPATPNLPNAYSNQPNS